MIRSSNSHDLRKSIARVLTIINAKQRAQLRLFYKNKKYAPLDLRPKQTRAIRRRLSPEEKSIVLEKAKKRSVHFPQRKYAIKVRGTQERFVGRWLGRLFSLRNESANIVSWLYKVLTSNRLKSNFSTWKGDSRGRTNLGRRETGLRKGARRAACLLPSLNQKGLRNFSQIARLKGKYMSGS